ncbi:MAG: flagellin, partial [Proteobacteria bacterium]|nr:flagellin [Pseudomonadota bacterium]
ALAVVDEKLTRMKELAEQAATGTYTTAQREIMDSEYQAMAAEIDRIATATDFNGVKLIDGSLSALHAGLGLKVHFGTANDSAEDYYYINTGDMRATVATGLQVGGGATADKVYASQGYESAGVAIGSAGAFQFNYQFNFTNLSATNSTTFAASNTAGVYNVTSNTTLTDLVNMINQGTAARTIFHITSGIENTFSGSMQIGGLRVAVTLSGTASTVSGYDIVYAASDISGTTWLSNLAAAVNALSDGAADVWALEVDDSNIIIMARDAGVAGNNIAATETFNSGELWTYSITAAASEFIDSAATFLRSGGLTWSVASTTLSNSTYHLTLEGNGRGGEYDLYVGQLTGVGTESALYSDIDDFTVLTEASGSGGWNGADILTQSTAQLALAQVDQAIRRKDTVRASLGALQNRLENTITNLTIQAENLQAAESRISDVDVALEMTEFTRNSILAQAATAMLAQANSLSQLALQLLGG